MAWMAQTLRPGAHSRASVLFREGDIAPFPGIARIWSRCAPHLARTPLLATSRARRARTCSRRRQPPGAPENPETLEESCSENPAAVESTRAARWGFGSGSELGRAAGTAASWFGHP